MGLRFNKKNEISPMVVVKTIQNENVFFLISPFWKRACLFIWPNLNPHYTMVFCIWKVKSDPVVLKIRWNCESLQTDEQPNIEQQFTINLQCVSIISKIVTQIISDVHKDKSKYEKLKPKNNLRTILFISWINRWVEIKYVKRSKNSFDDNAVCNFKT